MKIGQLWGIFMVLVGFVYPRAEALLAPVPVTSRRHVKWGPGRITIRGHQAGSRLGPMKASAAVGSLGWKLAPESLLSPIVAAGRSLSAQPNFRIGVSLALVASLTWRWRRERAALMARQTEDATSEWGRFADKPGARTRALLAGMLRMVRLILNR